MRWLFSLQQRLALTDREAQALALIAALLAAGLFARYAEARWANAPPPPRPLLAALPPSHTVPVADTLAANTALTADTARIAVLPADSPGTVSPVPAGADSHAADPPVAAAAAGPRMNLNTASAGLLQRLPGIGPRLAERIVAYRTTNGPFRSVDDLTRVKGIGAKTMDRLRPLLFVE